MLENIRLLRMGKFTRLFPIPFRFMTAEIFMSELAERACPTYNSKRIADSASSLSIHIDSLTSAPFCITVHRPGRLPIMSLHSYEDVVCHKFNLNRSSLNFSEATINLPRWEKYDSRPTWWDLGLHSPACSINVRKYKRRMKDGKLNKFRGFFQVHVVRKPGARW